MITLNVDGRFTIASSSADALAEGGHIEQTLTVTVLKDHFVDGAHLNFDGSYVTAETLTLAVCGVNGGPEARDDDFTAVCLEENGSRAGNVLADNGNGADGDVDRSDTFSVTGVDVAGSLVLLGDDGTATVTLDSGASLTIDAEGSFSYDTHHAFDDLGLGDEAVDSFTYQITDSHGATSDATASLCIDGAGGGELGTDEF